MMTYILQASVCLAGFYGFYHFFLRQETMFATNRLYLLSTLLISAILPAIKIYVDRQLVTADLITAPSVYVGSYLDTLTETVVIRPSATTFSWVEVVSGIYFLVIGLLLVRLSKELWDLYSIHQSGTRMEVGGSSCILSDKVLAPYSFFSTIYLPRHHSFSTEELKEVMSHEAAHIRGRHTWDVLLMEAACILMWPNPFIYLYRKSLKEVHEFAADAEVIKDTPWEAYAQLLVSQQQHHLQHILSNQFYSQLKKRLLMMNQQPSSATARWKYLGILPVLLMALLAFSFREKLDMIPGLTDETTQKSFIDTIRVHVNDDFSYTINGEVISSEQIMTRIDEVFNGKSDALVLLRTAKNIKVEHITPLMTAIERHHARIVLETEGFPSSVNAATSNTTSNHLNFQDKALTTQHDLEGVVVVGSPKGNTVESHSGPTIWGRDTPVFPGCSHTEASEEGNCSAAKLIEYISQHLRYPEALRKSGLEGKVFVKFVVGANGFVKTAEVIRSLSPEADQAALDLINSMNEKAGKWQPAIKEGKAIDTELVLPITFTLGEKPKSEPYSYVEEMPRFPGCEHLSDEKERFTCVMEKMYQFIGQNLWYPEEDRKNKIEGTGIVQFVVEADGQLSDIKVLRSPSQTMTAEMTRLMGEMAAMEDKWIPGRHEGKAVPVKFTLPIKFVLQPEEVPAEKKPDTPAKDAGAQIQVQPNPASHTITVTTFEGANTIQLFSADGKMMVSQNVDASVRTHQLDVSHLLPGLYRVKASGPTSSAIANLTLSR